MASWASRSESERENFVWWLRSTLSEERIWTIQLLESRATTRRYSGRAVRGSPLCRTASLEVVGIVEPSKINQWAKIAGELRARGGSVVRVAVAARKEADGSAPANAFASPDEKDTKDYGAFRKLVRAAYGRAAGADPDAKIDGRAGAERRPAPGARAWGSGSLAERKRAAGVALAAARAAVAGCPDWAHVDVSDFDEVWRSAVTRSPRGGPGDAPQVSSGLQVRGVLPADRARALAEALAPVQRRYRAAGERNSESVPRPVRVSRPRLVRRSSGKDSRNSQARASATRATGPTPRRRSSSTSATEPRGARAASRSRRRRG